MKRYRDCGSEIFNTGTSKCPFVPDYIKSIILTPVDLVLKDAEIESKLGELAHADRPGRIYPVGPIAEYAPSGGEAQTSKQGYGPSQITGYSELVETWTLENYDEGLFANLMMLKNERMRAIFIDANNVIYGENVSSTQIRGFLMSAIYPSGQRFKTSGDNANMAINLVYSNVEDAWKNPKSLMAETNLLDFSKGLVWVDVEKQGDSGTTYKVVEHYGKFDLTEMYGTLFGEAGAWDNVTAVSYEPSNGTLNITASSGGVPKLKSPSVLYVQGIKGIEQWQG